MSKEYFAWIKKHHKNTSYIKGRNFEYRVMRKLRKVGFYVVRKFGSKGHEDLLAVRNGEVLFVQCKWARVLDTKPSGYNLDGLIELVQKYGALAVFAGVRNRRMYFQAFVDGEWQDVKLD